MDGIIALGASKAYTNAQILKWLTTGSVDKGTWDAANNVPTLTQGTGTPGWYYHVSVAGTWEGENYNVGDTNIFDGTKNKWVRVATGGEPETPIVVAYVQSGDSFPTVRPSGNPLVVGDSVGVKNTAILPFTIDGVTFDSYKDTAVWNGTNWQEQSYSVGKTNEMIVFDATTESLSGTAGYQNLVNIENVAAINGKVDIAQGTVNVHKILQVNASGNLALADLPAELAVDNVTIDKNAANELEVKDGGLTVAKINTAALSLTIDDTSTDTQLPTAKAVNVVVKDTTKFDNVTIDKNAANEFEIKDQGITFAKLNDNLVTQTVAATGASEEKVASEKAIVTALAEKVDIQQGSANEGQILSVQSDGKLGLIDHNTKNLAVDDAGSESYGGTSTTQKAVNQEVVTELNKRILKYYGRHTRTEFGKMVGSNDVLECLGMFTNASDRPESGDYVYNVKVYRYDKAAVTSEHFVYLTCMSDRGIWTCWARESDWNWSAWVSQSAQNVQDVKYKLAHVANKTSASSTYFEEGNSTVKGWLDNGYTVTVYVANEKRFYTMSTYDAANRKATWLVPVDDIYHTTQLLYLQCYWDSDTSVCTMGYYTDNVVYTGDVKGLVASKYVQTSSQLGRPVAQRVDSSDGVYKQGHVYHAVSDGSSGYKWEDAYKSDFDTKIDIAQGTSNVGKTLLVNTSGNLTLATVPTIRVKTDTIAIGEKEVLVTVPDGSQIIGYTCEDDNKHQVWTSVDCPSDTSIKYSIDNALNEAITCLTYYVL